MKPPTIIDFTDGNVPRQHVVVWFCHVCARTETLPLGVPHVCTTLNEGSETNP